MQNWSLGVCFAFYTELIVTCFEFHAGNIEDVPLVLPSTVTFISKSNFMPFP